MHGAGSLAKFVADTVGIIILVPSASRMRELPRSEQKYRSPFTGAIATAS